jgi:hypothetical protein
VEDRQRPRDGRIKGRTVRFGWGVVFVGFFVNCHNVRGFRAPYGVRRTRWISWSFRTLWRSAMSDDGEIRIRPGRMRSTRAQHARSFVAQVLAAARRAGGDVSRAAGQTGGRRSRFGPRTACQHPGKSAGFVSHVAAPSSRRAWFAIQHFPACLRRISIICAAMA